MNAKCKCRRLSVPAFGISLGIVSGLCLMLFSWVSWQYAYGKPLLDMYISVYPGVEASLQGGFIALAWGFLEGFILGVIWAWIYNLCLCCSRCCCSCCVGKDTGSLSRTTSL